MASDLGRQRLRFAQGGRATRVAAPLCSLPDRERAELPQSLPLQRNTGVSSRGSGRDLVYPKEWAWQNSRTASLTCAGRSSWLT